jgi:hypothetical protein
MERRSSKTGLGEAPGCTLRKGSKIYPTDEEVDTMSQSTNTKVISEQCMSVEGRTERSGRVQLDLVIKLANWDAIDTSASMIWRKA